MKNLETITNQNIESIWKEYHHSLLSFIQKRISDKPAADDILQEVFLKILSKIDTLREGSKIRNWLYQITRNAIIDHYRSKKEVYEYPESLMEVENEESESALNELNGCLRPVVDSLPQKYRDAFLLSEIEGISQKEIASQLNISYTATKSRVQRSRAMVKETLARYCSFKYDARGNIMDYDQDCEKC